MKDRITPFGSGGNIEDRIDEVVLTDANLRTGLYQGAAHLEMLDESHAMLWLGSRMFTIYAKGGKLFVALRDGGGVA
jgi:hypothetical protein